jgi:pyruvate formate-lyase/glycerol dehydratase family glycyl radical enzyme
MEYTRFINNMTSADRINVLKEKMLSEPRYMSLEQAKLITEAYAENEGKPVIIKRALALRKALENLEITIEEEELIVGNRTRGVRGGVVFPESGISWIDKEIETLPSRPQDKFNVKEEDIREFRERIAPFWKGNSLEDIVKANLGEEVDRIVKVAKINQKDHAQGHICPNTEKWLQYGPAGLMESASKKLESSCGDTKDFCNSIVIVLEGACNFMKRYAELASQKAMMLSDEKRKSDLLEVSRICQKLSCQPPETFHEAVQSVWFLYVILHMESNASSFSPGRMDQYLYPYFQADIDKGIIDFTKALEIIECMWLKFNQIVYLRNSHSAKYFAGFPIGFNVAIGGQLVDGSDATNELSYLFLKAQEHIGLPQPNLSARLYKNSPDEFLKQCVKVIAKGSGMPQCFNDEAIIPALRNQGISEKDAINYAIVGCVELTTHGNNLGWSDAAMFNLIKVLELTLNNGICLLTGEQIGLPLGDINSYAAYEDLEAAFAKQMDYFIDKMIRCCEVVERIHMEVLPSPFLSSVIDDCLEKGIDVTAGGAHYNLSGIQVIQGANIADSLAAIKKLVYDEKKIEKEGLLEALRSNFKVDEPLRLTLLNHAPKYGNDIEWVDEIAHKWIRYFNEKLKNYRNIRGGVYHTGLYTVSAHVPMGQNVGATADGRFAKEPLADGGMSPVYGRDIKGPTAVLKSVSRVDSMLGSNGTLLNMKFLPEFFNTESGVEKFAQFLKTFVRLNISHIQFNVLKKEDLLSAKKDPEKYRGLTVRVAGYTAYFTELADDLQNEIIARTSYGDI